MPGWNDGKGCREKKRKREGRNAGDARVHRQAGGASGLSAKRRIENQPPREALGEIVARKG